MQLDCGYAARFFLPAALAFFCATAVQTACAKKELTYIGQNTVDSLCDRAYYVLGSAGDPASGITQEAAVAAAKRIAQKLRGIAQSDQNRQYILGKTGELENQIYLEEAGLLLEKEKFRQKSVNDLVPVFNTELGKPRPDFKELWATQKRMAAVDGSTGIDAENAIRKRAFALGNEVPRLLEYHLDGGNLDSARTFLAYCRVNGAFLGLSLTRYASLEAKVKAKKSSGDEREEVIRALERFRAALKANNLKNARIENDFVGGKIMALRSSIRSYEWVRLNKDYELFTSKYRRKTDSLVDIAITRLRNRGPYVAAAFLDTMRQMGLTIEKVNKVDQMILESVVAEKQRSVAAARASQSSTDSDSADGQAVLNDLLATARSRAVQKTDSQVTVQKNLGVTTQIEEVRKNRLRTAYKLREMRERDVRKTDTAVALQTLCDIYTCIEKKQNRDAGRLFKASKDLLKKNLPAEDYRLAAAAAGPLK